MLRVLPVEHRASAIPTRQQKQIHMGDETAPSLTVWRAAKGRRPKPTPLKSRYVRHESGHA
jgi:hypothetical protein